MRPSSLLALLFLPSTLLVTGCGWSSPLPVRGDGGATDFGVPHDGFTSDLSRTDFGPGFDLGPDFGFDSGPPRTCSTDSECDDRIACDGREVCAGGRCAPGTPTSCSDGIDCTSDSCSEPSGTCSSTPDSSRCAPGELCRAGIGCVRTPCDPTSGTCDDGVFCNGPEYCASDGLCHAGTSPCGGGPGPCGVVCDEPTHSCSARIADADGDGHADLACGGDDCNDANPAIFPGNVETCGNGIDDNCNGLVDCADPLCGGSPGCGCMPRMEDCTNGVDDDCNGLVDCMDSSCIASGACSACVDHELGSMLGRNLASGTNIGAPTRTTPSCGGANPLGRERTYRWTAPAAGTYTFDTIGSTFDTVLYVLSGCGAPELGCDDDGAGSAAPASLLRVPLSAGQTVIVIVDTYGSGTGSTGTYYLSITLGATTETGFCADGVDNDGDGLTDCADPDCTGDFACCRPVPENCGNGRDDDCDRLVDCGDPDCRFFPACAPRDGGVDAGPSPDGGVCLPHENTVALCTNGRDDNCDTRVDCADPDCRPFGPMGECCNGVDDNADGTVDEFTCRCFADSDCVGVGSLDQSCWTTTFHVCAPRCNFYGGTVGFCQRFLGMASTCNAVTGECEGAVIGG